MLFNWLVTGLVVPVNPAASVQGPRYSASKGLTPIISAEEAQPLFSGMDLTRMWSTARQAVSERTSPGEFEDLCRHTCLEVNG